MTNRDEWTKHVAEWRASGLSAEEFSNQRGLSKARLWAWSSRLRRAERAAAATSGGPVLARVVRRPSTQSPDAVVVLEWHGVRVNVGPGADRETLVTVLAAVGALSSRDREVAR